MANCGMEFTKQQLLELDHAKLVDIILMLQKEQTTNTSNSQQNMSNSQPSNSNLPVLSHTDSPESSVFLLQGSSSEWTAAEYSEGNTLSCDSLNDDNSSTLEKILTARKEECSICKIELQDNVVYKCLSCHDFIV